MKRSSVSPTDHSPKVKLNQTLDLTYKSLIIYPSIQRSSVRSRSPSVSGDEEYVPYVPLKERREKKVFPTQCIIYYSCYYGYLLQLSKLATYRSRRMQPVEEPAVTEAQEGEDFGTRSKVSLLDQHSELKKKAEGSSTYLNNIVRI